MSRFRVIYDEETRAGMFLTATGYDDQGMLHVRPHFSISEPWFVRWVSHRRPFWRRLVPRAARWRDSVAPIGMASGDFEAGDEGYILVSGTIRL